MTNRDEPVEERPSVSSAGQSSSASSSAGQSAPGEEAALAPGCAAVEADLAELALGVLTGKERVAALAHIDSCPRCAAEVEQLSGLGDQLLALAPSAEPPVGFEAGVFSRLGLHPGEHRRAAGVVALGGRRRWRWEVLAGAAAAIVFAAGALTGVALKGGRPASSLSLGGVGRRSDLQVEALDAHGRRVGNVMVYAGNPTWLFMYVNGTTWTGPLYCEVTVQQGRRVSLGQFWLSGGRGAWAASTDVPAGRLSRALIVGQGGVVLASARLG